MREMAKRRLPVSAFFIVIFLSTAHGQWLESNVQYFNNEPNYPKNIYSRSYPETFSFFVPPATDVGQKRTITSYTQPVDSDWNTYEQPDSFRKSANNYPTNSYAKTVEENRLEKLVQSPLYIQYHKFKEELRRKQLEQSQQQVTQPQQPPQPLTDFIRIEQPLLQQPTSHYAQPPQHLTLPARPLLPIHKVKPVRTVPKKHKSSQKKRIIYPSPRIAIDQFIHQVAPPYLERSSKKDANPEDFPLKPTSTVVLGNPRPTQSAILSSKVKEEPIKHESRAGVKKEEDSDIFPQTKSQRRRDDLKTTAKQSEQAPNVVEVELKNKHKPQHNQQNEQKGKETHRNPGPAVHAKAKATNHDIDELEEEQINMENEKHRMFQKNKEQSFNKKDIDKAKEKEFKEAEKSFAAQEEDFAAEESQLAMKIATNLNDQSIEDEVEKETAKNQTMEEQVSDLQNTKQDEDKNKQPETSQELKQNQLLTNQEFSKQSSQKLNDQKNDELELESQNNVVNQEQEGKNKQQETFDELKQNQSLTNEESLKQSSQKLNDRKNDELELDSQNNVVNQEQEDKNKQPETSQELKQNQSSTNEESSKQSSQKLNEQKIDGLELDSQNDIATQEQEDKNKQPETSAELKQNQSLTNEDSSKQSSQKLNDQKSDGMELGSQNNVANPVDGDKNKQLETSQELKQNQLLTNEEFSKQLSQKLNDQKNDELELDSQNNVVNQEQEDKNKQPETSQELKQNQSLTNEESSTQSSQKLNDKNIEGQEFGTQNNIANPVEEGKSKQQETSQELKQNQSLTNEESSTQSSQKLKDQKIEGKEFDTQNNIANPVEEVKNKQEETSQELKQNQSLTNKESSRQSSQKLNEQKIERQEFDSQINNANPVDDGKNKQPETSDELKQNQSLTNKESSKQLSTQKLKNDQQSEGETSDIQNKVDNAAKENTKHQPYEKSESNASTEKLTNSGFRNDSSEQSKETNDQLDDTEQLQEEDVNNQSEKSPSNEDTEKMKNNGFNEADEQLSSTNDQLSSEGIKTSHESEKKLKIKGFKNVTDNQTNDIDQGKLPSTMDEDENNQRINDVTENGKQDPNDEQSGDGEQDKKQTTESSHLVPAEDTNSPAIVRNVQEQSALTEENSQRIPSKEVTYQEPRDGVFSEEERSEQPEENIQMSASQQNGFVQNGKVEGDTSDQESVQSTSVRDDEPPAEEEQRQGESPSYLHPGETRELVQESEQRDQATEEIPITEEENKMHEDSSQMVEPLREEQAHTKDTIINGTSTNSQVGENLVDEEAGGKIKVSYIMPEEEVAKMKDAEHHRQSEEEEIYKTILKNRERKVQQENKNQNEEFLTVNDEEPDIKSSGQKKSQNRGFTIPSVNNERNEPEGNDRLGFAALKGGVTKLKVTYDTDKIINGEPFNDTIYSSSDVSSNTQTVKDFPNSPSASNKTSSTNDKISSTGDELVVAEETSKTTDQTPAEQNQTMPEINESTIDTEKESKTDQTLVEKSATMSKNTDLMIETDESSKTRDQTQAEENSKPNTESMEIDETNTTLPEAANDKGSKTRDQTESENDLTMSENNEPMKIDEARLKKKQTQTEKNLRMSEDNGPTMANNEIGKTIDLTEPENSSTISESSELTTDNKPKGFLVSTKSNAISSEAIPSNVSLIFNTALSNGNLEGEVMSSKKNTSVSPPDTETTASSAPKGFVMTSENEEARKISNTTSLTSKDNFGSPKGNQNPKANSAFTNSSSGSSETEYQEKPKGFTMTPKDAKGFTVLLNNEQKEEHSETKLNGTAKGFTVEHLKQYESPAMKNDTTDALETKPVDKQKGFSSEGNEDIDSSNKTNNLVPPDDESDTSKGFAMFPKNTKGFALPSPSEQNQKTSGKSDTPLAANISESNPSSKGFAMTSKEYTVNDVSASTKSAEVNSDISGTKPHGFSMPTQGFSMSVPTASFLPYNQYMVSPLQYQQPQSLAFWGRPLWMQPSPYFQEFPQQAVAKTDVSKMETEQHKKVATEEPDVQLIKDDGNKLNGKSADEEIEENTDTKEIESSPITDGETMIDVIEDPHSRSSTINDTKISEELANEAKEEEKKMANGKESIEKDDENTLTITRDSANDETLQVNKEGTQKTDEGKTKETKVTQTRPWEELKVGEDKKNNDDSSDPLLIDEDESRDGKQSGNAEQNSPLANKDKEKAEGTNNQKESGIKEEKTPAQQSKTKEKEQQKTDGLNNVENDKKMREKTNLGSSTQKVNNNNKDSSEGDSINSQINHGIKELSTEDVENLKPTEITETEKSEGESREVKEKEENSSSISDSKVEAIGKESKEIESNRMTSTDAEKDHETQLQLDNQIANDMLEKSKNDEEASSKGSNGEGKNAEEEKKNEGDVNGNKKTNEQPENQTDGQNRSTANKKSTTQLNTIERISALTDWLKRASSLLKKEKIDLRRKKKSKVEHRKTEKENDRENDQENEFSRRRSFRLGNNLPMEKFPRKFKVSHASKRKNNTNKRHNVLDEREARRYARIMKNFFSKKMNYKKH